MSEQTPTEWHWDEHWDELADENGKTVLRARSLTGGIVVSESHKKLITAAPELLDALETLLSECERVDYKPTQPLRFLSYNPAVITKALNAIKKAKDKGNVYVDEEKSH